MEQRPKILHINSVNYGSTGNIMLDIAKKARENGYDCFTSNGVSRIKIENNIFIGSKIERYAHYRLSELTGMNGCFSKHGTKKFLKQIDRIKPDIIHLHNLHGWYINLKLLFDYIKRNRIKVVWTLHDCWSFTGHCPHFDYIKCEKWKTGCYKCLQYKNYPQSLIDKSKKLYFFKKKWFTGIQNLHLVCPSIWIADLVSQSFLQNYNVSVINNFVNLDIFKPRDNMNFRNKNNLKNKYTLLAVAAPWSELKGYKYIMQLSEKLDDKYKIVMVGLTEDQISKLPSNIIGIKKTDNVNQLVELYSTADLFINTTLQEVFGLVNVEALACGTPVITFNTGGCPEIVNDKVGMVVEKGNIELLIKGIDTICKKGKQKYYNACIEESKKYEKETLIQKYLDLYKSLL